MTEGQVNRVLKAGKARTLVGRVAFNYEDIQRRCRKHIEQTREQATAIIDDAKAEADKIRARAFDEGIQHSREQAICDAESNIEERIQQRGSELANQELKSLIPIIEEATQGLMSERERWLSQWETSAIRLSVKIAEKLLRHEITVRPELISGMIRAALELITDRNGISIRLNPLDHELLNRQLDQVRDRLVCNANIEWICDDSVSRGGVLVQTEHGEIDGRIEMMLDRISSELIGDASN